MTGRDERRSAERRPAPIVLVVLDGFGIGARPGRRRDRRRADADLARRSSRDWPHAALRASEDAVGLPPGQMGNSEVGHLNLGAGRPVLQDLPRIDAAIADGVVLRAAGAPRRLRPGERRDRAAAPHRQPRRAGRRPRQRPAPRRARRARRPRGRAERPRPRAARRPRHAAASALGFVADLEAPLAAAHPDAAIATVGGRYYAMDRDQRWERVERGYDAIVHAEAGQHAPSATAAIEAAYARGETDEFVAPTVIDGVGTAGSRDGDAVVHANFRADRARQLTHALADGRPSTASTGRRPTAGRPRATCSS